MGNDALNCGSPWESIKIPLFLKRRPFWKLKEIAERNNFPSTFALICKILDDFANSPDPERCLNKKRKRRKLRFETEPGEKSLLEIYS